MNNGFWYCAGCCATANAALRAKVLELETMKLSKVQEGSMGIERLPKLRSFSDTAATCVSCVAAVEVAIGKVVCSTDGVGRVKIGTGGSGNVEVSVEFVDGNGDVGTSVAWGKVICNVSGRAATSLTVACKSLKRFCSSQIFKNGLLTCAVNVSSVNVRGKTCDMSQFSISGSAVL